MDFLKGQDFFNFFGSESKRIHDAVNTYIAQINVEISELRPALKVLLTGATGSGKSFFVHRIFEQDERLKVLRITSWDIYRNFSGQFERAFFSHEQLSRQLRQQNGVVPCFVFDMIEHIFPRQGSMSFSLLRSFHNFIFPLKNAIVILVSHSSSHIHPHIIHWLRDNPLGSSHQLLAMDIPLPVSTQRSTFFSSLGCLSDDMISHLSDFTEGCHLADLLHLYTDARHNTTATTSFSDALSFKAARKKVNLNIDFITFQNIGGLSKVKQQLNETIIWPRTNKQVSMMYDSLRIPRVHGILLYGAPGTGKTMIARALAHACKGAAFLSISMADLIHGEVGLSERALHDVFQRAIRHRPSVIFMDEMDSLFQSSSTVSKKLASQLLLEWDLLACNEVVLVGATNFPQSLDPTLLKRFDHCLYIPLPDLPSRIDILSQYIGRCPYDPSLLETDYLTQLAMQVENYTGADLHHLVKQASWHVLQRGGTLKLSTEDLQWALVTCHPSVTPAQLSHYQSFLMSTDTTQQQQQRS